MRSRPRLPGGVAAIRFAAKRATATVDRSIPVAEAKRARRDSNSRPSVP
jgi:hypothetical protein